MFLVAFAVLSLLSYGGRACKLTGQPNDVVAEVGANATITCQTDFDDCTHRQCKFHWYRLMNDTFQPIGSCGTVRKDNVKPFLLSGGPNWSLSITGVVQNDARKYRCKIVHAKAPLKTNITYGNATLIIPSILTITVKANPPKLTVNETVVFSCYTRKANGARLTMDEENSLLHGLTYQWKLDGLNISSYRDNAGFHLGENSRTVEIKNIQTQLHSKKLTCAAYSGSTLVKRSKRFTIRVHDHRTTTQQIVTEYSTFNPNLITTTGNRVSVTPGPSTEDHRSRAPAGTVQGDSEPHTPSILTKQEPDPGIDHPGNGNTALFAGGGVGAVFLILVIVSLIYCLVFKGRSKTRSQHPNPRDGDGRGAGAVELAETQPTEHAASESAKASTSSTGGSGSVEPRPLDSQQTQVNVHRDQVCEDTPLSVEESTPFDCGYKPRLLDPVYALVDKSRPQIGKSAAEQSSKVSPKDGPKVDGITANDAGRDESQSGPTPGVNVAPVAAGSKPDGAPTGKKPPRVTPYHLSKSRKRTGTGAKSEPPEQTADRGGDGAAQDDPRLRNAEGLIYADLDLTRGSPRVVSSEEEETLYAGIVNKETVGNLREGSIHHAR